ncbi:DUF2487 family protein [Peribacillus cavernae]|uniref:DUF2487 family protein n=1 Tax=Peribacillus cavernae TaxID=1674310 RepID=A0A433HM64_9BACI|nr:YpiF family protein [Peribacillus cavernae]MDQ0218978.1 hypothetical protein [Peribacillus cavernae]RUQ29315.1 DUF2487 family protein [Peribacillus cavernae]
MRWTPKDIDTFDKAREYIDTVLVPLVPVAFENGMKQSASMYDFITLLTAAIEHQFKGRIMLMPSLAYLSSVDIDKRMELVNDWKNEIGSFQNIYFITSDSEWKAREPEFAGTLIWMPSIPLEHFGEEQVRTMVGDQARQVFDLFKRKWNEA